MRLNHIIILLKIPIDLCTIKHSIMIKNHICSYCLQSFSNAEILERHTNDGFKINSKKTIKKSKKGENVKFENYERRIKSPFMIYADFESILGKENNKKQNPYVSYTNKCQIMFLVVMVTN